jgi:hypothetical protein
MHKGFILLVLLLLIGEAITAWKVCDIEQDEYNRTCWITIGVSSYVIILTLLMPGLYILCDIARQLQIPDSYQN